MRRFLYIFLFLTLVSGIGYYYVNIYKPNSTVSQYKTEAETDEYVRFGMEAFDSILANYWDEPKNYNLPTIFKLSLEKALGKPQTLASTTREATAEMFLNAIKVASSTEQKKEIIINTLIVVTYNLQPVGRNGILSTAQETELRQNVSNINPAKDLYQDLGLEKGATVNEINVAYEKKEAELKASSSPEAKATLDQVAYAKKVLTNPDNKILYDEAQIEPTVWSSRIGNTLYLHINKISPTTFVEFARAVDNASTTKNLDSMILDLRGNVGGSLDFVQNFMGLFLGPNQYAFDLFRQATYNAQRTVQPKFNTLERFKEIGIITDNMTQSTAEVISASFKRLNLGKTVGTNTRGWGTVENTYPINTEIDPKTKYTLLLVNSITLRDDNQPIEGRGVDPNVNTTEAKWQSKLPNFFNSTSLIKAIEATATKPPLK